MIFIGKSTMTGMPEMQAHRAPVPVTRGHNMPIRAGGALRISGTVRDTDFGSPPGLSAASLT